MKKRLVLVLTVGLSLLLAACGIPQEDYDDVVAERDAAQNATESAETKVTSLETELSTAQSQIASLKSELAITQILVDLLGDTTRVETDAPRTTSTSYTAFSKYGFSFDYPQGSSPMELGLLGNNADDNSGLVQVYLEGGEGIVQVTWVGIIVSTFNLTGSLPELLDDSFEGMMVEGIGTLTKGKVVNTTKAGHELIYQYYKTTMLGMNISGVIGVFYCEDSQRVYQLMTMMYTFDTEQEAIQYFQSYLDSFSGH